MAKNAKAEQELQAAELHSQKSISQSVILLQFDFCLVIFYQFHIFYNLKNKIKSTLVCYNYVNMLNSFLPALLSIKLYHIGL